MGRSVGYSSHKLRNLPREHETRFTRDFKKGIYPKKNTQSYSIKDRIINAMGGTGFGKRGVKKVAQKIRSKFTSGRGRKYKRG